jgi:hypothetical protein
MMIRNRFVSRLAIRPRRKMVATALIYGLSMAVRFTSAAGEQTEVAPEAARGSYPITSIMINNGGSVVTKDWPRPAQPIAMPATPTFKGCRAACDSSTPVPLTAGCSYP